MKHSTAATDYPFLAGGNEMGELTRTFDWSTTSIGSPEHWPQSLRTTVSLLLASRFPMLLWWGNDLIQFYNDAYRPSFGIQGKHPTALGQRCKDCWPEIWTTIKPLIDQVLTKGESTWSEDQLIPVYRNGQLEDAYWTFSYSPVRDESGGVGGILIVCSETTGKVQMLRKAEESEELFRFAIDSAELGTWDLNLLTNRLVGNSRLKEWLGLPPDAELTLAGALNVIAEPDRQRISDAIDKALRASTSTYYDINCSLVHPQNGTERIVRAKGKVHLTEEGVAYRFNGTLQDITNEVRSQQKLLSTNDELLDSIRQFKFVTDFMPQMVWATLPDGYHDFYNKGWYTYTGLTYEETKAEGWNRVLHPDDQERAWTIWRHSLQTGDPYEIEYRFRRHDGEYRWFLGRALPMRTDDGRILRWFGTCTDIHDQKTSTAQLEDEVAKRTAELRETNHYLQRSNENLQRFAYVASHDLQEPLRKIQSFGTMLETASAGRIGEEGSEYLSRMLAAASRMSILIKDLLAFSRITTRRDALVPVSLTDVVNGVLTDLELAIQESGATIETVPLPTLPGDAPQLRQLFQNLLSNAIKFRRRDQPLSIQITCERVEANQLPDSLTTTTTGPFYRISVIDNGIGFDEKYLDRIFQVFQRLHGRSQYSGTGIGLAIVQKVVENHGGVITASSRPGSGATFVMYLPGTLSE